MDTTETPSAMMRRLRHEGREGLAEDMARSLLDEPVVSKSVLKEAAYLAFHRKDWVTAAERYQRVLDVVPSEFDDRYYERLYRAYVEAGETEKSLRCLMEGIYRYPEHPALKPAASARSDEIAKEVDRWSHVIGRTGPMSLGEQALLFKQLFMNGEALAAHQFKEMCAQTYREWPVEGLPPVLQYQRAAASVYLGDHQAAHAWLTNQNWPKWGKEYLIAAQLIGFCDIALGADPKNVFDRLFKLEHGDDPQPAAPDAAWTVADFTSVFRGKSVAIVGPANTGQTLAKEIDGFDIVVRTNVFSFDELARAKDRLGTRTDISYYTNATYQLRQEELYSLLERSPLIPVLRRRGNLREAGLRGVRNARICSPTPRNFLPNYGSMHAVQRIIWDLSKFGPSRIKLFNVNFYGGALYDPSYTPRNRVPDRKSLGVAHDPLQGFMFAKTMLEQRVVEADPVATEILGWSRWQYIDMLQRDFADHWKH